MSKHFISANDLLTDSFLLAEQIHQSNFRPDFIVGIWRGGAPVGIAVQEYLDYMGVQTNHIAIRTSSYYGVDQQNKDVQVHGLDYVINHVQHDQALLIVDDVFDSGRSIFAVISAIQERARRNAPAVIKVACPWYKPARNQTQRCPDYYVHTTDQWLVFPHELQGLSLEEITKHKGKGLANTLKQGLDKN